MGRDLMPSLRSGHLPEHVRRQFVEAGSGDLGTLLEALKRGDNRVIKERVHAIKGVLQMLGEVDVARLFLAMELQCELGHIISRRTLDRAMRGMQGLLARHAKPSGFHRPD